MNNQFKRCFAVFLAVLMLVSAVPYAAFAVNCDHDFGEWETLEGKGATCTKTGEETRKCTKCSTTETRKLKALGHDIDGVDFTIEKEATCSMEGSKYKVCRKCEEKVEITTIPKIAHSKEKTVTDAYLVTPAYCESPAVYYFACKVCGQKLDETYRDGTKNPDNHINFLPLGEGTPATCNSTGVSEGKKCKDCGKVLEEQVTLDKLSHVVGIPATCTTLAVCKNCDKTFGVLNPSNHVIYTETGVAVDATQINEAVPATCTSKGMTEGKTCTKCKTVVIEQKETDLAPHTLEVIPGVEPTCTKEGSKPGSKCTVCGYIAVAPETIEALGHDETDWIYPEDFDCTKGGIKFTNCKREGCDATHIKELAVLAGNHTPELDPQVPATCLEKGKTAGEHCSICGYITKIPVETDMLEHDYSGEAKSNGDGTHHFKCINGCEKYGATASLFCTDTNGDCKCDACGYQLEHKYGEFTPDGNATCSVDGTKTQVCSVCGEKNTVTDENSKATGKHSFTKYVYDEGTATCTEDGNETAKCDLCGEATTTRVKDHSALGHSTAEWTYPTSFDCTAGGVRYKICKRCSQAVETENLIPTNHNEIGDEAVPATCTTAGKTAGSHCSVCGLVVIAQTEIPAAGHKYAETVIREATCSQTGEMSYRCDNCSDTYTAEIPMTPHSGEWKIIKQESCLESGMKTRICTVCANTETVEIDKLPHTEVVDKGIPATCTKTGVSDGSHCSACGTVIKEQIELAAKGHTKKVVTTPATTSKSGKTVTTCTVCGKSLKKVVISKIKSIKLSRTTFEYNGKSKKPTVTVKDSQGKTLKNGTDYTVKYSSGRKNIGSYKVVVTFKGKYSGSKTLKFTVTPKIVSTLKVSSTAKKSVTLKWSKAKYATKYVVYYATSKNGTYSKLGSTSKLTFNATKLKSGKTYYFYVKSVKKTNNGNFYADASPIKKATVK